MSGCEIHHWSVKVYDGTAEKETVRGLSLVQKNVLMNIFDREGVRAQALAYNGDGSRMIDSESVNWSTEVA